MRNGIELVDILDKYLKEKGISRRQFCALTDIPNSTVATWKSKNRLPSVELAAKVAKFMNVSLDDLAFESNEYFEAKQKQLEILEKIKTGEKKLEKINTTIISIYSDLESIKEKLSEIEDI